MLVNYLEIKPEPGIVINLFEIQTKLFEVGSQVLNNAQVLTKTLEIVCHLLVMMSDRNSCKAILFFTQLLFTQDTDE